MPEYLLWKMEMRASTEKSVMKKILIPLILVVIGGASQAQSAKKPPPPPPPRPKNEVVKFVPTIVDEKIDVSKDKPPVITVKGKMADDFYNRNPSVSAISRQENIITLRKKDGTVEKYDMTKKEEHKSFTEKYGVSPIPPPPPPPKKKSKA
jgi:hypothetical protein